MSLSTSFSVQAIRILALGSAVERIELCPFFGSASFYKARIPKSAGFPLNRGLYLRHPPCLEFLARIALSPPLEDVMPMACEAAEEQLITGRGGQSLEGWLGHFLSGL